MHDVIRARSCSLLAGRGVPLSQDLTGVPPPPERTWDQRITGSAPPAGKDLGPEARGIPHSQKGPGTRDQGYPRKEPETKGQGYIPPSPPPVNKDKRYLPVVLRTRAVPKMISALGSISQRHPKQVGLQVNDKPKLPEMKFNFWDNTHVNKTFEILLIKHSKARLLCL